VDLSLGILCSQRYRLSRRSQSGSQPTRRWREVDSNPRSPVMGAAIFFSWRCVRRPACVANRGSLGKSGRPSASHSLTQKLLASAYERNHPGRPWASTLTGPGEVTGDQMVAAMEMTGASGASRPEPSTNSRRKSGTCRTQTDIHTATPANEELGSARAEAVGFDERPVLGRDLDQPMWIAGRACVVGAAECTAACTQRRVLGRLG